MTAEPPSLLSADAVRVILASQSPRRRELLTMIGIPHEVKPADVDETPLPDEAPLPYCDRLARAKADHVASTNVDALVVGSDTIVVVDGDILGKPASAAEAHAMLARLSGRTHVVHTAVAVAYRQRTLSAVETVQVTFRALSSRRIAAYVATGEPMDKAGAYGIQGFGAVLVERIDGDFFAVMGLAIGRLIALMGEVGVDFEFAHRAAASGSALASGATLRAHHPP